MKCDYCDGCGYVDGSDGLTEIKCWKCNGTGEIKQTNDEWRKTCSAEEFAEWMAQYCCDVNTSDVKEILKNEWLEWLREKHIETQNNDDYPCNAKGCSMSKRQSCCGCPEMLEWEKKHK